MISGWHVPERSFDVKGRFLRFRAYGLRAKGRLRCFPVGLSVLRSCASIGRRTVDRGFEVRADFSLPFDTSLRDLIGSQRSRPRSVTGTEYFVQWSGRHDRLIQLDAAGHAEACLSTCHLRLIVQPGRLRNSQASSTGPVPFDSRSFVLWGAGGLLPSSEPAVGRSPQPAIDGWRRRRQQSGPVAFVGEVREPCGPPVGRDALTAARRTAAGPVSAAGPPAGKVPHT